MQAEIDRRRPDRAQRGGDILGDRSFDLADEAQCEVELLFALPGPAGWAPRDYVETVAADDGGRPKRDEQAYSGRQDNMFKPADI